MSGLFKRIAPNLQNIKATLPKLSSLEKFGSWLELNTTTTPSVAPKTPPEEQTTPNVAVESPPPPQQPTKHTGKLFMALPKFDNPPTTIKDKIIAQLETKLLDIDTSNSTIKFGKENKSGHPKAKLEAICELLHQWKNTVGNNTNDKNELKEFIEKTKDKFYEKGIDLSNGYEYENHEGSGKQIQIVQKIPFKANITYFCK